MKKKFEIMIDSSDLVDLGFKPFQAKQIIRECKDYLVTIEGIDFYDNRQVKIVPARIVEKLFSIQIF